MKLITVKEVHEAVADMIKNPPVEESSKKEQIIYHAKDQVLGKVVR